MILLFVKLFPRGLVSKRHMYNETKCNQNILCYIDRYSWVNEVENVELCYRIIIIIQW